MLFEHRRKEVACPWRHANRQFVRLATKTRILGAAPSMAGLSDSEKFA